MHINQHIQDALTTTATPQSHPKVEAWDWRFEAYDPGLEPVLPAVKDFCASVLNKSEPKWITLLGPSGVGKTHILTRAFRFLARFMPYIPTATGRRIPQCAHIMPSTDLNDYKSPRDYAAYDLIYIEDIGAGAGLDKGTGAVLRGRVAELMQLRAFKWTMCDANMYRSEIAERVDPRIASRLKRDGSFLIEIPPNVPDFNDREP